ncbi:MAG: hemerythrin domain-containing protein [Planctomycetales bacterium]|nr:hemerythrin domain-containing protein [Planctomycetales bacterium]
MDTHTVTINAAFLREIKDDDVQLKTLLEQARAICDSSALADISASRFTKLLADLRDHLAMHFALEEAYGYFDDPLSVAPHLSEQAESLRTQHGQLYGELARLAETAQDISRRDSDPRAIRNLARCFMEFHDRLQQHEEDENELIMEALYVDIGGSG